MHEDHSSFKLTHLSRFHRSDVTTRWTSLEQFLWLSQPAVEGQYLRQEGDQLRDLNGSECLQRSGQMQYSTPAYLVRLRWRDPFRNLRRPGRLTMELPGMESKLLDP